MSGVYKPLIIIFGALSSMLCVWIVYKLELTKADPNLKLRPVALVKYLFWLTIEIGKADWAVTKVILSPKSLKRQRLIGVPAGQSSDFGKMLFANSITITPGTVTVETETEQFIVHALTDEAADFRALNNMGARVCAVEGSPKEGTA